MVLEGFGVTLPQWMKLDATDSYLEARNYQERPDATFSSLMDGTFQAEAEQYIADSYPRRDEVLLINASLQRQSIRLAAQLMGYDIYPTFYGSYRCYDVNRDAVIPLQGDVTDERVALLANFADVLNAFADRHPECHTVVYITDSMGYTAANPTSGLVTDAIEHSFITTRFFDLFSNNITKYDGAMDSTDAYFDSYSRGNHHLNMSGVYNAYAQILAELKPNEKPVSITDTIVWDSVPFYGAQCRIGLCKLKNPDYISDVVYDESGIVVTMQGEQQTLESVRARELYGQNQQQTVHL